MYNFSERSIKNLKGVHPDLVRLMKESIKDSPYDFMITEGLRTLERQKEMVRTGKSQTMNSYHLVGKAVDIALIVDGTVNWEFALYREVANHIKKRAKELGIKITWGGDWKRLKDGPHFQLEDR
ncbi:MAG: M15 family metallopeptidase [Fusobacterium necrophorum]|nr:M15 family metallopeptidase [Fusobacterium necrophorum]